MNLKLRFKNKTTLISFLGLIISLTYQILAILSIVPSISEGQVTQIVGLVINILGMLGVFVDPTTQGVSDSEQAKTYTTPN